jgi:hypothetical protein
MPRKKQVVLTYENFVIEITRWKPSYSIGLNVKMRLGDGHYFEQNFLELSGTFIEPPKLAGRTVRVSLSGDRTMSQAVSSDKVYSYEVRGIGYVYSRGKHSSSFLKLPYDAIPVVTTMFALGRCKYLGMIGERLRYGSAVIRNVQFEEELEE